MIPVDVLLGPPTHFYRLNITSLCYYLGDKRHTVLRQVISDVVVLSNPKLLRFGHGNLFYCEACAGFCKGGPLVLYYFRWFCF